MPYNILCLWKILCLSSCLASIVGCGSEKLTDASAFLDGGSLEDVKEEPLETDHEDIFSLAKGMGHEPAGLIPVCCLPSSEERALIDEVFRLLNEFRSENGIESLVHDDGLARAIQGHCHHMAIHPFFAHEAPEESVSSPWVRAEMCGSKAGGENLAAGQASA